MSSVALANEVGITCLSYPKFNLKLELFKNLLFKIISIIKTKTKLLSL